MENIKITDNLTFSRIIQGFWRLEDWNMNINELDYFMNSCIDRGVNVFDTAEIYSDTNCEKIMGDVFKNNQNIRKNIKLVTKTGIFKKDGFGYYDTSYKRVIQSCKESLKRLNTDYIDLYLIHREDPCIDHYETATALKDLKKEGLVREVGVSNFDPFKFDALNHAMDGQLVTNQIEVSPICFEHFSSGMIDFLQKHKIKPMVWSPLAGGKIFSSNEEKYKKVLEKINVLAEKYSTTASTIIYAWILYHPVKFMPINGSGKLERLDMAIKALEIKLEHYEWYQIYCASGDMVLR